MAGQHYELKGLAHQTIIGIEFGLLSLNFYDEWPVKVQGKVQKLYLKTVAVIMPSSSSTSGMIIVGSQV